MKLSEIYQAKNVISFEVFPPKENDEKLLKELEKLKVCKPAFVSLTCGAGGKGNKSFGLLEKIMALNLNVMPHFTCITSTKQSVSEGLAEIERLNAENILALRGDIPENSTDICHDFIHACNLVDYIKSKTNLSVGVAGYPEGHIESPDLKTDIENLKKKVDAGADVIFTQLFFENEKFFDFLERVEKAGIKIPVAAGIMPILHKKQINKMTSLARITVPDEIKKACEKYNDLTEFGIDYASRQCSELMRKNVAGLHFYTLNKSYSTLKILDNVKGALWRT